MKTIYLSVIQAVAIHDTVIHEFGGAYGLRAPDLLESAIHQPMQSFGGEDLYPTLFEKGSAYAFSISENQPFVDGNKRTAASVSAVFLDLNGYLLDCPQGEVYETMMKLANKKITRDQLSEWFRRNSRKIVSKIAT